MLREKTGCFMNIKALPSFWDFAFPAIFHTVYDKIAMDVTFKSHKEYRY